MANGANISQGAGQGEAGVFHWEGVNNTLAQIHQRDITNQQRIQAQHSKLEMQMSDAARKMRAADMPEFFHNMKEFQYAGLMLQNEKVKKDPNERAKWEEAQNNAYYNNLSLAEQSKKADDFKVEITKGALNKPGMFQDADMLQRTFSMYDKLTIGQLQKTGMNTPYAFLHKADTYSEKESLPDVILGKPKTVVNEDPVYDQKGKLVGWNQRQQQMYERPIGLMAKEAANSLGNWNYAKDAQKDFESTPAQARQAQIAAAQKIVDGDPKSGGYKLNDDYTGLYIAKWITQGTDVKDVGSKGFKVNPLFLEEKKFEQAKELKKIGYDYGMSLAKYRSDLTAQRSANKDKSSVNVAESFFKAMQADAYNNPRQYKYADGHTEMQYKVMVDPKTKKIFETRDPVTGKLIQPDEIHFKQNGDVVPIFFKRSKQKDGAIGLNQNAHNIEIDEQLSQPTKKEQFLIRLSQSFLSGKAETQDVENDIKVGESDGESSSISLPINALAGLMRLVNKTDET